MTGVDPLENMKEVGWRVHPSSLYALGLRGVMLFYLCSTQVAAHVHAE